MPKKSTQPIINELPLASALRGEVSAWADQGWPGVTQTTHDLLAYWFLRDEEDVERFHDCQRRAVEVIIYCHEILRFSMLKDAYERLAPDILAQSAALSEEVASIPFPKYALKMATGTGKTWVLAALLVWQYFNALNCERPGRYSAHFLLVAPGHEVLNRLLDMFLGKHDPKTSNRDKSKADFERRLFMPDGERWRNRFNLRVFEPSGVRANTTPPDEPFVYITNWQQFVFNKHANMWNQLTGADVEDAPRGEVIADFLAEYPDLIVLNDEAHHVHGSKSKTGDELVWRRFIQVLHERMVEHHKEKRGLFLQIDFSATPFFGSGERKEYFPHIIYDYGLVDAMHDMLVKQIFLEERQLVAGEDVDELKVRAERAEPEGDHRRGAVIGLASDQKLLLDIGRKKMEQIAEEFKEQGIEKKPVLFILAENTEVADLVAEHFRHLTDERGRSYEKQTLVIHSKVKKSGGAELTDKEWEEYRLPLETLDEPEEVNPIRVVISVLMLREGFDTRNVAVTVVLRSAEADLLLEQVVGRGLRLMFPAYEYPELQELKREAREDVMRNRPPQYAFDFLFVVEHPRFKAFYDELRAQGYAIGIGDSGGTDVTGDLALVEATPDRIAKYDIVWPVQVYEQAPRLDVRGVDIHTLPSYKIPFDILQKHLSNLAVTETHAETGGKVKTWKLENEYFDYNHFLRQATLAVARERGMQLLTGQMSGITAIVDEYVNKKLFGQAIDFSKPENYIVLNYSDLFDFIVGTVRRAIVEALGEIQYEARVGKVGRASDVKKIYVRGPLAVPVERCIYPKLGYRRSGEGFEKKFIEEVLNVSGEVEAFLKLQERKHDLNISYRDRYGITRPYYPDFIAKTAERMFVVETKAEDEIQKAESDADNPIVLKTRAARSWCKTASKVKIEGQSSAWEYLVMSDKDVKENSQLGFEGLVGIARATTERLARSGEGRLL
ncbi:MAG: DEAD/DEAH box helicase family protein [Patescibacteria group bacterium]